MPDLNETERAFAIWNQQHLEATWKSNRTDLFAAFQAGRASAQQVEAVSIDTAKLRKVAEAATPGPWTFYKDRLRPQFPVMVHEIQKEGEAPIVSWGGFDGLKRAKSQITADARFIATFNPAVALALLDALALRQAATGSADGLDALLSPQDRAHFDRFMECCEDSDSGGHDVPKEAMARLCELGVVRRYGVGTHIVTALGHYIHEGKDRPPLPLATFDERNARNRAAILAQQEQRHE